MWPARGPLFHMISFRIVVHTFSYIIRTRLSECIEFLEASSEKSPQFLKLRHINTRSQMYTQCAHRKAMHTTFSTHKLHLKNRMCWECAHFIQTSDQSTCFYRINGDVSWWGGDGQISWKTECNNKNFFIWVDNWFYWLCVIAVYTSVETI